ncbi:MAG: VTT domain-containing protein [Bacillota bacterium]|nr:VTT domain-containing protein [Bacillota bacterium]
MSFFSWAIDFILHMDRYLPGYFHQYGAIIYLLLFFVIFCETGLVVTPFLPGDSLIFAAAMVAATTKGESNIFVLFIVLLAAAFLGNMANFFIGGAIGQKIYNKEKHRFIKKENIDSAMDFFNRHGKVTIIITRFMPIIRTFTPFVAGIAKMKTAVFALYNFLGGLLWVAFFLVAGYFLGTNEFVAKHLSLIMMLIVIASLTPPFIAYINKKIKNKKA